MCFGVAFTVLWLWPVRCSVRWTCIVSLYGTRLLRLQPVPCMCLCCMYSSSLGCFTWCTCWHGWLPADTGHRDRCQHHWTRHAMQPFYAVRYWGGGSLFLCMPWYLYGLSKRNLFRSCWQRAGALLCLAHGVALRFCVGVLGGHWLVSVHRVSCPVHYILFFVAFRRQDGKRVLLHLYLFQT